MVILLFPPVPIERDILAFFAAIDPLPASNIDLESHTANKTRSRFGSTSRHYWWHFSHVFLLSFPEPSRTPAVSTIF